MPAVRAITDDEVPAWCAALNTGFLNPAGDVDAELRRPGLILDQTLAGFDADTIVATLRSFPAELSVPGGGVTPASAVTAVATVSTHRRRGFASQLVRTELAASRDRGETVSMLIASEGQIYGRFGYGPATEHQTWTVDALSARMRHEPIGSVEYTDRDAARALAPGIHDRHRAKRPGQMSRSERFWDIDFGNLRYPSWSEPKPGFVVVARDLAGEAIGVARYEVEQKWVGRLPDGQVTVQLFVADGPQAESLLWHHLINLDLVARVRADDRPADELLPWLLTDPRRAQASGRSDFLWLRPLDVPAMLSARTYHVNGEIVLEVVDGEDLCGGRFVLAGGPDGAQCSSTSNAADLTLDVAALSSCYLGGFQVRTLAAAGLIDEHAVGAVARADAMFHSPIAPWCSTWF